MLNRAGGALTPRAEFARRFGLHMVPQTFDLTDKDGRLATLCRRAAPPWDGYLLYLRADLVTQFLDHGRSDLIWIAWGERELIGDPPRRRDKAVADVFKSRRNLHRKVRIFDRKTLSAVPMLPSGIDRSEA